MKCFICRQEIKSGDKILSGCACVYRGPTDSDLEWICPTDHLDGSIHLSCLESPSEASSASPRVVVENLVERSDALSLLGL